MIKRKKLLVVLSFSALLLGCIIQNLIFRMEHNDAATL